MAHHLVWYGAAGAVVPLIASALWALGFFSPRFLGIVVLFCPGYVGFVGTAACSPLDACTLEMLAWVTVSNIVLYVLIGILFWFTKARYRAARYAVVAVVAAACIWWANMWAWGVGWGA